MTKKREEQFNRMLAALRKIANDYQTPEQIRKGSKDSWGLDADEALEMAYENLQNEAKSAAKNIRPIKPTTK